jgi:hypothetical protein
MPLFLLVKQDTFFKLSPQQSIELEDNEKVFINAGSTYELASYAYTENNTSGYRWTASVGLSQPITDGPTADAHVRIADYLQIHSLTQQHPYSGAPSSITARRQPALPLH